MDEMGSPLYGFPEGWPASVQHFVFRLRNGTNVGPIMSVMLAHQRWVGSLKPVCPLSSIRKTAGAVAAFQSMDIPPALVGKVTPGGRTVPESRVRWTHWLLAPVI